MQTIPPQFTTKQFNFKVLKRQGRVVLLSKSKPHWDRESFEVVRLNRFQAGLRFGKMYPERELMPSDEQWGSSGWTATSRETAERLFLDKCEA